MTPSDNDIYTSLRTTGPSTYALLREVIKERDYAKRWLASALKLPVKNDPIAP